MDESRDGQQTSLTELTLHVANLIVRMKTKNSINIGIVLYHGNHSD